MLLILLIKLLNKMYSNKEKPCSIKNLPLHINAIKKYNTIIPHIVKRPHTLFKN